MARTVLAPPLAGLVAGAVILALVMRPRDSDGIHSIVEPAACFV